MRTRHYCSVSNKLRTTENCLDLSPIQFTPPTDKAKASPAGFQTDYNIGLVIFTYLLNRRLQFSQDILDHQCYLTYTARLITCTQKTKRVIKERKMPQYNSDNNMLILILIFVH